MSIAAYFALYSLLIVASSLLGGWVPMLVRLTHRRLQFATSLIAGFMLGVALLHLMPHALASVSAYTGALAMLVGLLAMFFLERFFSYHHHTAPGDEGLPPVTADPEAQPVHCDHSLGHAIDHHHGHDAAPMSWTGVSIGLVLHSVIAGGALAAAMVSPGAHAALPGLAVLLVIVLHKPFDSMTLLTLMKAGGWRTTSQHVVNGLFALAVPVGGLLFFLGLQNVQADHSQAIGLALAASAGVFLCVALADLLPEVQFHRHDRGALSAALLLGLALAWTIGQFEHASHDHANHAEPPVPAAVQHDDHNH